MLLPTRSNCSSLNNKPVLAPTASVQGLFPWPRALGPKEIGSFTTRPRVLQTEYQDSRYLHFHNIKHVTLLNCNDYYIYGFFDDKPTYLLCTWFISMHLNKKFTIIVTILNMRKRRVRRAKRPTKCNQLINN